MMGAPRDDQACRNLRWSVALLDGLVAGGMRHLVLSPGSRSTPVVLAGQRQPALQLTPILDERSAAFFALGLARATRQPVGLLCTSGSAPAHWFPAVIEAAEWGLPLILLTADRPPELRAWGANQTVDQIHLFGRFVREFHDPGPPRDEARAMKTMTALGARAASVSRGRRAGPVHINLPFPEPLVPDTDCDPPASGDLRPLPHARPGAPAPTDDPWSVAPAAIDFHQLSGPGLICCGPGEYTDDDIAALWSCATNLGLPVLVDPLSGLRFGPAPEVRVTRYDSFLRNPLAAAALRPAWVVRLGRPPVSRVLNEWLTGVPSLLVDPAERWCDPTHDAVQQITATPAVFLGWLQRTDRVTAAPGWLDDWLAADQRLTALAEQHLAESPWCEPHLIQTLIARLPAGDALFCANSLPIRQLDTWSGARARALAIHGNRGVSGIDGQVSTLAGLTRGGLATWGLLGDLAFCHDLSGLLLAHTLDRPCLVLNNGGGRIFDYLPQRHVPGVETLWRTPLSLDLGELVRPFGVPHRIVTDGATLDRALDQVIDRGGARVIEIRIDATSSQRVHEGFWQRVARQDII
ncbi:2-succinyl-5-enolpyruvyl-6-hydroxy-3-cyclohexene-1-carboxylic-acid synthase [Thioalkalicoccus limnaeus]|uniref:2-succinyl-5-enolpyruvyl-6-hydroxy-3-cyclohexene-1-carboxylate synthase n=1 Tax=Thioalkalicoccus limnaeus TaxID=120681 RepID=A0ABV4BFQ4_9GAMM